MDSYLAMTYLNKKSRMSAKFNKDKVAKDMIRLLENIFERLEGQEFPIYLGAIQSTRQIRFSG